MAQVREAWTGVGDDGEGRRMDLTQNDNFRQICYHPRPGWTTSSVTACPPLARP